MNRRLKRSLWFGLPALTLLGAAGLGVGKHFSSWLSTPITLPRLDNEHAYDMIGDSSLDYFVGVPTQDGHVLRVIDADNAFDVTKDQVRVERRHLLTNPEIEFMGLGTIPNIDEIYRVTYLRHDFPGDAADEQVKVESVYPGDISGLYFMRRTNEGVPIKDAWRRFSSYVSQNYLGRRKSEEGFILFDEN